MKIKRLYSSTLSSKALNTLSVPRGSLLLCFLIVLYSSTFGTARRLDCKRPFTNGLAGAEFNFSDFLETTAAFGKKKAYVNPQDKALVKYYDQSNGEGCQPVISVTTQPLVFNLMTLGGSSFNTISKAWAKPATTDLDGDGLVDLLVGGLDGTISHYEQESASSLTFSLVTTSFNGISLGATAAAAPAFTDLDGDGLLDMLVGITTGLLVHYEQASLHSLSFNQVSSSFNGIDVGLNANPTFTDLDGDGLLDLLIGEQGGNTNHYEQTAANSLNFTFVKDNIVPDVGNNATPNVTDLDGDGLLDILVGEQAGNVNYYKQDGPNSTNFVLVNGSFNSITTNGMSAPVLTDLDHNGKADLLIGVDLPATANPVILHYESVGQFNTFGAPPGVTSFSQVVYTWAGPCLTENLLVTAPANFEVSLSENTGFGSSVTILQTGGKVIATPIYVRFRASASGTYNGDIQISSTNAATVTVALTGTDAYPQMSVEGNSISIVNGDNTPSTADATDFGEININIADPVSRTFAIKNSGSSQLNLTGSPKVVIEGPDASQFMISTQPASPVYESGSRNFTVAFNPSSKGLKTASISIANDDPAQQSFRFSIQGTSNGTDITVLGRSLVIGHNDLTPSPVDGTFLGSALVNGENITKSFTIKNQTTLSLSLSGDPKITISGASAGDFAVTAQPLSTLAADRSTSFEITFDPSGPGLRSALVSIAHDGADGFPFTFAIDGLGTSPTPQGTGGIPIISAFAEDFGPRALTENFNISPYPLKSYAHPLFTDLNGNNLLDLVVGHGNGTLDYYEQDAFNSLTFNLIEEHFSGISLGSDFASPDIADIDGDGLLDLLIGSESGGIAHWEQDIHNGLKFTQVTANFNAIDVGEWSSPKIVDLDQDGRLDLLIGKNDGTVDHYEQAAGNSLVFDFVTANFNNINVGELSAPTVTDVDGDGLLDLLVAQNIYPYRIHHYAQTAVNSNSFTLVTDFYDAIAGVPIPKAAFTDLDRDGLLDMYIGSSRAVMWYAEQIKGAFSSFTSSVSTPSASQPLKVFGKELVSDITVTAPTDFEVSLSATTGFGQSVTLTPSDGKVLNTTLYVRYKSASAGTVNGQLVLTSQDANTITFDLTGTATPLPVTLISFSAKKAAENQNLLTWITTDEKNFDRFDVERSKNARSFEVIGTVKAKEGKTTSMSYYHFSDTRASGDQYYRLKMIDLDGTYQYSKIIAVGNSVENPVVGNFYPNPASENVHVDIYATEAGSWNLTCFDLTGKVVHAESRVLAKGMNTVILNKRSQGVHLIRFDNGKTSAVRKLVNE